MVQYGEPVRPVKEVEAVGMEVSPKGETIIDFGQNLAGVLRVKVDLPVEVKNGKMYINGREIGERAEG